MSLTTLIKTIQDIMRKDVGVDGDAQRISQICWLLFRKRSNDAVISFRRRVWISSDRGQSVPSTRVA